MSAYLTWYASRAGRFEPGGDIEIESASPVWLATGIPLPGVLVFAGMCQIRPPCGSLTVYTTSRPSGVQAMDITPPDQLVSRRGSPPPIGTTKTSATPGKLERANARVLPSGDTENCESPNPVVGCVI